MPTTKNDIDLRHLRVFVALYELRSATRAAELMQTTQPGISIALARLRSVYGDPLFVRTGQTMQPTTRAEALLKPISDALHLLDDSVNDAQAFDPRTSTWHVRLALPDGGRVLVLPRLAAMLQREAPKITTEIMDIGGDTPEALERGDVDLAFGFMTARKQGLYQQRLFQDRHVCVMRRGHPLGKRPLTQETLQTAPCVRVSGLGNSSHLLARALERAGVSPTVTLVLPTALGLAETLCSTDHIAMLPRMAAQELARFHPLQLVTLPIEMEPYEVCQHWHRRKHDDVGHRWLREQITGLFSASAGFADTSAEAEAPAPEVRATHAGKSVSSQPLS